MSTQDQNTTEQTVSPLYDDRLATHDIVDTAAATGNFPRLLELVRAAGIEGEVRNPDLVTLLAPADAALAGLTPERPAEIAALLRGHLLRGAISGADLRTTPHAKTLAGTMLPVSVEGSDVRIGGARVTQFDISCTNGMIHVLDGLAKS